jgi:hypothetical protein
MAQLAGMRSLEDRDSSEIIQSRRPFLSQITPHTPHWYGDPMTKHHGCWIITISALFLGFRSYANQIEYLRFVVLFRIFNLQERLS